jgi:hypothetical protein
VTERELDTSGRRPATALTFASSASKSPPRLHKVGRDADPRQQQNGMNQRVADLRWHTEEDHNDDLEREGRLDDDNSLSHSDV